MEFDINKFNVFWEKQLEKITKNSKENIMNKQEMLDSLKYFILTKGLFLKVGDDIV